MRSPCRNFCFSASADFVVADCYNAAEVLAVKLSVYISVCLCLSVRVCKSQLRRRVCAFGEIASLLFVPT